MRAAEALVVARALALADRDRAAVVARAPRARRARSGRRARPPARPRRSPRRRASGAGSRQPKKFGCWKITQAASSAAARELVRVGRAAAVRHLDDLEPEARRVGLDDLAHLRVRRLGDARPWSGPSRASRCSRRRRRRSCRRSRRRSRRPSRSARRSRSGTRRSPAGRPGSSRAGTACTRSGTRRAGARRRRPPARSGRRCRRRGTRARRRCGRSRRELARGARRAPARTARGSTSSCAAEAHARRDVAEELVDRRDADRREHRLAVGVSQREE